MSRYISKAKRRCMEEIEVIDRYLDELHCRAIEDGSIGPVVLYGVRLSMRLSTYVNMVTAHREIMVSEMERQTWSNSYYKKLSEERNPTTEP